MTLKPVEPKDIAWGKYKNFAGPYFKGRIPMTLPLEPTETDRQMIVISSTEGARVDAVNMYDQCVLTVGLIQWCEAKQFSVSDMLGTIIDQHGPKIVEDALRPALDKFNVVFKKNSSGRWRFFTDGGRIEVRTVADQQQLFLGCDGNIATWEDKKKSDEERAAMRERPLLWAACMANVWLDDRAVRSQVEFTRARLPWFILADAKKVLLDGSLPNGWVGALRAAYLSFGANNPAHADKALKNALVELSERPDIEKWSQDWCTCVLKHLTFDPGIFIYPERYNKIRPVLEKLWLNVHLPKTHVELRNWGLPSRPASDPPTMPTEYSVADKKVDPPSQPGILVDVSMKKDISHVHNGTTVTWVSFLERIFRFIATLFMGKKNK